MENAGNEFDKPLSRVCRKLFHLNESGCIVPGAHAKMTGDCSGLYGDCSGLRGDCSDIHGHCTMLYGDCSGLRGDCSGLRGDCTWLQGDCSWVRGNLSHIPIVKRSTKPNLSDWIRD